MPQEITRHVAVVYTEAGGGHRAAAEALREILEKEHAIEVTFVNPYQDVVKEFDLFDRWTSRNVEQTYNEVIVGRGVPAIVCLGFYALAILNGKLKWRAARRKFSDYWKRTKPDIVISVMPLINQLLLESLRAAENKAIPFVILITDWKELSPYSWFPRQKGYYAICGTGESYRQRVRAGQPQQRLYTTNGLLLRPQFSDTKLQDRAAMKLDLGLTPNRPAICVLYGANGSERMYTIAREMSDRTSNVQLIFLCGHNQGLVEKLQRLKWRCPVLIQGFTREVHRYLAASDIFVGKPGPGCVSEALALGLYLVIDKALVLPQERAIIKWVKKQQSGGLFKTLPELHRALNGALSALDSNDRVPGAKNTAALEIFNIVNEIMSQTDTLSTVQPR